MNDKEILYSLASTMELTRAELDGMRVVLKAAVATLAAEPSLLPSFLANVQAKIYKDEAISLATVMPDDFLKARADWVRRLLPGHVHTMLRLP